MFCPQCGKELPDDAKFCMNCGYQIPRKDETAEKPAAGAEPVEGPEPKPAPPMPEATPEEPPTDEQAEPAPTAPVVEKPKLTPENWLQLVFTLGLVGTLFAAFLRFGSESYYSALMMGGPGLTGFGEALGYAFGLARTSIGSFGYGLPVIALLLGGLTIFLSRFKRDLLEQFLPANGALRIGGGVALTGLLMAVSNAFDSTLMWFIFCLLTGATLAYTALILLSHSDKFQAGFLQRLGYPMAAYSLLVYAGSLVLSGLGSLLGVGFLAYSLPRIFMVISGIAGVLGVLGFAIDLLLKTLFRES
jgi:hypothetical protein